MIRAFFNRIARFLARRTVTRQLFYINGKKVTEAEWYINGGLEAEEHLAEAEEIVKEFNKKYPASGVSEAETELKRSLAEMKKEFRDWKEFRKL